MSVTSRVTSATSAYSAAANTRLADGVRATPSSQSFSPILESSAAANVGAQDQGLRNDEWGAPRDDRRQDGLGERRESPIRLGSVLASNEFTQALFEMRSREPASNTMAPVRGASREATDIYESNMRVIAARRTGEKLMGGNFSRYY